MLQSSVRNHIEICGSSQSINNFSCLNTFNNSFLLRISESLTISTRKPELSLDGSSYSLLLQDIMLCWLVIAFIIIISDPRRGRYMGLRVFIFSFFFSFFSATILSGPYLLSRYSQRLQIECAAWSCSLILPCCLPSNSLHYFFFFFSAKILSGPYLWNSYLQRLQTECAAWSCSLILHCCLPSNSLRYFFYFFFPPLFCPGDISGTVTRRDSKLSVLLGLAV